MAKKKPLEPPLPPAEPERWIDMYEAATFLGLTRDALYLRLYKGQKIPHERIGWLYRFRKSALDQWRASNPAPMRKDQIASRRPTRATERQQ